MEKRDRGKTFPDLGESVRKNHVVDQHASDYEYNQCRDLIEIPTPHELFCTANFDEHNECVR